MYFLHTLFLTLLALMHFASAAPLNTGTTAQDSEIIEAVDQNTVFTERTDTTFANFHASNDISLVRKKNVVPIADLDLIASTSTIEERYPRPLSMPVGSGEPYCHDMALQDQNNLNYCRASFVQSTIGLGKHIFLYSPSCGLLGHTDVTDVGFYDDFNAYSVLRYVVVGNFAVHSFRYADKSYTYLQDDAFQEWYWGDAGMNSVVWEAAFDCSWLS